MKIWIGVTDYDWFRFLSTRQPDEVNFWAPGGGRAFKALQPGELFLFKLHSPRNFIVGGGYFVRNTALPCSLAWAAFGEKNGVAGHDEFLSRIARYRRAQQLERDPVIGCNILTEPFFFDQQDWIPMPSNWAMNIVQGKAYNTQDDIGTNLWLDVQSRLGVSDRVLESDGDRTRYGAEYLTRARLGQGAFRVLVTEAYDRRCAITGERTLPVLQASHIKPFKRSGPNLVSNGLLLRSDLHLLFDAGYLTVTPNLDVEVSNRIKEEFKNGREYYAHHGRRLAVIPPNFIERPSFEFLKWHNENCFEKVAT